MQKLLNRVQQQLSENTPVEAEDIQALVDFANNHKDEASGRFKNETKYIWQIRGEHMDSYRDNVDNKMLGTDFEGLVKWVRKQNKENLGYQFIKRTVKEDLIQ